MKSYIEQLEEQNDELQKRLATLEQVADLRKFAGLHSKIGNAILIQVDHQVSGNQFAIKTINMGNQQVRFNERQEVTVDVHLKYVCDDDGAKIVEFIKELSNYNSGH